MKHPEIVKNIITEVCRKGETDNEWTHKYEQLKTKIDINSFGEFVDKMLKLKYSIEEINIIIKDMV